MKKIYTVQLIYYDGTKVKDYITVNAGFEEILEASFNWMDDKNLAEVQVLNEDYDIPFARIYKDYRDGEEKVYWGCTDIPKYCRIINNNE